MDQNNELEAKICKEKTRNTETMDLREFTPQPYTISLPDETLYTGTTIRIQEDHMINCQIIHSIEAMEVDLEMELSTIRIETGETLENVLVVNRRKGETSHRIFHIANQEVINLTIQLSADLKIDLRLVLHLTNKIFHETITRFHAMWFALTKLTLPLMNYQAIVRETTKVSELEHRQISKFQT